jgi:hypothetical protein
MVPPLAENDQEMKQPRYRNQSVERTHVLVPLCHMSIDSGKRVREGVERRTESQQELDHG